MPFSAHGFCFAAQFGLKGDSVWNCSKGCCFGSESLWGGGVAHSVLILALVVLLGVVGAILTLIGVLSGASTNPPALAYSAEQTSSDAPSVGYATLYLLSMFLRVLAAQLLILIFG